MTEYPRKERKKGTSVTLDVRILSRIEVVKSKMRGGISRSGYINDAVDAMLYKDEKELGII